MHTDEQHESAENTLEPPKGGGIRTRVRTLLSAAAARLRDVLGADSLSVPAEVEAADRGDWTDRRGAESATAPPESTTRAGTEPAELTVSRADGRLRVSGGGEAYIESDTWEEVER
ncbi:MAG: hypothetical protein V5A13_02035 [Haloarculaceae archaeon]